MADPVNLRKLKHSEDKYSIVMVDHEIFRDNQRLHFTGKSYDFRKFCFVKYSSSTLDDCIVEINKLVDKEISEPNKKIDKLKVTDKVIELYDRSSGFFTKNNIIVKTYLIDEREP